MPFAKVVFWDSYGARLGRHTAFVPMPAGGWRWHLFVPIGHRVATLIIGWRGRT